MNPLVKLTALTSVLALASLGAAHFATAKDSVTRECLNCSRGGGNSGMQNGQDQDFSGRRMRRIEQPDIQSGGDQGTPGRRMRKIQPDNQVQQDFDDNDDVIIRKGKVRKADRNWKFDSNRHERRRKKDKRFRYFFGGFWYPAPYWYGQYYDDGPYRVSCGEGAEIVSERFNRVRVVECSGRVYTYLGRRQGDRFEVQLNSRTGRIIGAREI